MTGWAEGEVDGGRLASFGRVSAMASFIAVFVPSLVLLLTGEASYAGASDEKVSSVIAQTYGDFLAKIGWQCLLLTLLAWCAAFAVTFGLALAFRKPLGSGSRRVERAVAVTGFAVFTTAAIWGWGAGRHPGLFLGALAASRLLATWVEASAFLLPMALLVALVGYLGAVWSGTLPVRVVLGIALGATFGAALTFRARAERPARAPFAAPTEAAVTEFEARTPPPSPGKFPNVLWIAVDSLRPDKIDPDDTPNLAALLSRAVYFRDAVVPVPRTGPSWAAALTSMSPMTNGIETMFPPPSRADLSNVALPAHLAAQGYRTLVTSEYAGEFFGRVRLGFEYQSIPRAELREISGQVLLSRAPVALSALGSLYASGPYVRSRLPVTLAELVRGMPNFSQPAVLADDVFAFVDAPGARQRPAFALAFYSQPHFPYTSSPRFAKKYRVSGASAALAYGRDVANETPVANDADRKQLEGLYRGALAESDAAVGALLAGLESRGMLADTIVILSADHGEGLYECTDCVGHGDNLHTMTTLRVPLAFVLPPGRYPEGRPRTESGWVSTMDVYPTLLALLGLAPIAVHEGVALLDAKGGSTRPGPRSLFAETGEWLWTTAAVPRDRMAYPPITELARLEGDRIAIDPKFDGLVRAAKHRAVLRDRYKLRYEPTREGVHYRLFDVVADPDEAHDLSTSKPTLLAEMKNELRRSMLRHSFVLPMGDFFLTRPASPGEEHW